VKIKLGDEWRRVRRRGGEVVGDHELVRHRKEKEEWRGRKNFVKRRKNGVLKNRSATKNGLGCSATLKGKRRNITESQSGRGIWEEKTHSLTDLYKKSGSKNERKATKKTRTSGNGRKRG